MAGETILGDVIICDINRSEDDTDDISVQLFNSDGVTPATVVGWTATLRIGIDSDAVPLATFSGVGIAGGFIPIDLALFAVPIGSYKYDIRVVDTVTADSPARVYFKGKFKVTARIN